MKTYSVLYAEDVPHYATHTIEAKNNEQAIERAKAYDWSELPSDPDHHSAVCRRIVHIESQDTGDIVADGIALDEWFLNCGSKHRLLCEDAPKLLEALEATLEQLEIWVDFSEPGKDPEAEVVAAEARDLIARHRSPS